MACRSRPACPALNETDASTAVGAYRLALGAQPGAAQFHHVALLKETRWLQALAHSRRSSGNNQVARMQRHEMADVADEEGNLEDHGRRRARLMALAIDLEPQVEILRIGDFIGR